MKLVQPYVLPRPFNGYNIPGAIQSAYLKNYSIAKKFDFRLPIVEITTSSTFYLLKGFLNKNKNLEINISLASLFVFPIYSKEQIKDLFEDYLQLNITLHGVLENKIFSLEEFFEWTESVRNINNLTHTYNSDYMSKIMDNLDGN